MKIYIKLILLLLISFFSNDIASQEFQLLNDNTGFNLTSDKLDSLNKYSAIAAEEFALNENDEDFFKVYDSGIYLHNLYEVGDSESAITKLKSLIPQSQKSYLLFTKILVNESDSMDLNVEFVFDDQDYSCLDTDFINTILNQTVRSKIDEFDIYDLEVEILKRVNSIIKEGYCCSNYYFNNTPNKSMSSCVDLEKIDNAVLALSSDPRIEQLLVYLKYILEENDPCGNWQSFGKHGIVPTCVWENTEVNVLNFFKSDLPFSAGLVDGASSEIYGIYNLLKNAEEILKSVEKTARYYTLYLLYCKDYNLSPLELEIVFDQLLECDTWYNESAQILYSQVYGGITLIRGGVGSAVLWLWDLDCENDLEPLGAVIDSYVYFGTNSDSLEMFGNQILSSIDTIMSSVDLFDNVDRYYIGYYGFKSAFILAGVGKAAATMTVKLAKMASKMTGNLAKNLGRKILSSMADDLLIKIRKKSWYNTIDKAKFEAHFSGNYFALRYFNKNPSAINAWKVIKHRNKQISADLASVKIVEKILTNQNRLSLGLTDEVIGGFKGSTKYPYRDIVNTVDEFALKIHNKNINIANFDKVLSDLSKGGGWSEGSEWTLKYISKNIDDFAGKQLKFEFTNKYMAYENAVIRRIDLVDETTAGNHILFEFKSVKTVPPGKFNEQFIKDLWNPKVKDLSQVKWRFDGRKLPEDFTSNMTAAINNLPLKNDLAVKFLGPGGDVSVLRQALLSEFDEIFKLVN